MSDFLSWADAPSTGAYTSSEIGPVVEQAVEDSKFLPFADRMEMNSGASVTIPSTSDIDVPTNSTLNESTSIPLDKMAVTTKLISIAERGRGLSISRKNMRRSPIDLLESNRSALANQIRLDFDKVLAAAFKQGQLKYVATGAASYNLATGGSAGAAALSNPNYYHIRKMRDLAFRTYLMPMRPSGEYVYITSTAGKRGIMDDPDFLEINKGAGESRFGKSDVGVIENVRILETNHDDALDDDIGTNTDVGEGIFIADEAVKYSILSPIEVHFDQSHDHGRFVTLAWYGDWGADVPNDSATAGFPRLLHFTSS